MKQLILLIPRSIDEAYFDQHWPEFLHQAESMPGLVRESANRVESTLYGKDPFSRIYRFTFPDRETLDQALSSEAGQRAGELIHRITEGQITILIADHRLEEAQHLPQRQANKSSAGE